MTLRRYVFSIFLIFFLSINLFGLTVNELKIETAKTYKDLTLQDWKDKSDYRGITRRSQKDFDSLIPMYVRKISALREQLTGDWDFSCKVSDDGKKLNSDAEIFDAVMQKMDDWHYANSKEQRLVDKFATCVKEVQMRKDGDVVRTDLHDQTDYFIDYVGGNDGSAGTAIGTAWKTITKYTTTTIRTPGDRAFVRAGITWLQGTEAVSITFDEDGNADLRISLIGCDSVTNDPWTDTDDTLPVIDFEDAAFHVALIADRYWWIERIEFANSDYNGALVECSATTGSYFKDCFIHDMINAGEEGMTIFTSHDFTVDGCSFEDCQANSIVISSAEVHLKGCTFTDGAEVQTAAGINIIGSTLYMEDCVFSGAFANYDMIINYGCTVYTRNITWSGSTKIAFDSTARNSIGVYLEDDDATFEINLTEFFHGIITRGTASSRGGGADSYAIMVPNANCGVNTPLRLGNKLSGAFKIWLVKDVEVNISVWARVGSAWDGALTAAQAYARYSYLSNAVSAARVELQSTEQISNVADWTTGVHEFTSGAFTPLQTGFVYVWFYVAHWEDASEEVWVDIKPVVN